jgi:hypothetical protein
MESFVRIADHVVWFKHVEKPEFAQMLERLKPDEEIVLEAEGATGLWKRMADGGDGRSTPGIRPTGEFKRTWNTLFRTRKESRILLRKPPVGDDHLAASAALFSEWSEEEDEEAFRDL